MRITPLLLLFLLHLHCLLSQSSVTFVVADLPALEGQKVGIRGSALPLSWERSLPLKKDGERYYISLEFADSLERIEFKFVLFDDDQEVIWEGTQNRFLRLKAGQQQAKHSWNVTQIVDVTSLPTLQPDQLMEEYQLIETMVLSVHPGTYRYQSEASIRRALERLKADFEQPMPHGQVYLAIAKMMAQIQCGHTKAGLYNQKATIHSLIHGQQDKLPFSFTWIGDKMVVLQNASQSELLKAGTEIVRINGVETSIIQKQLIPYMSADGATDKTRMALLSVAGYDFDFYPFDVFFPLLFPLSDQAVSLDVKGAQDTIAKQIRVGTLTREKRAKILAGRYPDFPETTDDLWHFKITDDGIGILELNSFALYGLGHLTIDYKAFLADVFEQLQKRSIQHLIVDIRQNKGGNDEIKHELFTYFPFDEEAPSFERIGKTRYLEFPEVLKPYVRTWGDNPWYFNLKPDRVDEQNGYYLFEESFVDRYANRKKAAFDGNLYLLTSPLNTSLAFYLAADFKQKQLGTIIGQETGGNLRDINGGQILILYLPHSEIAVEFPVMGGFTLKEVANEGVAPDIIVQPKVIDVVNNRDTALEAAIRLIRP